MSQQVKRNTWLAYYARKFTLSKKQGNLIGAILQSQGNPCFQYHFMIVWRIIFKK